MARKWGISELFLWQAGRTSQFPTELESLNFIFMISLVKLFKDAPWHSRGESLCYLAWLNMLTVKGLGKYFPFFPLVNWKALWNYLVSLNFSVLTAGSILCRGHMVIEKSQSQKQAEMSENNDLNKYSVLVWMTRQVDMTAGSQLPEVRPLRPSSSLSSFQILHAVFYWWYLLNTLNLSAVSISTTNTWPSVFSRVDRHNTHSHHSQSRGSFLSHYCASHCPSLPLPHRAEAIFYNEVFLWHQSSYASIKLCHSSELNLSASFPLQINPNSLQRLSSPPIIYLLSMFNYNSTSLQLPSSILLQHTALYPAPSTWHFCLFLECASLPSWFLSNTQSD